MCSMLFPRCNRQEAGEINGCFADQAHCCRVRSMRCHRSNGGVDAMPAAAPWDTLRLPGDAVTAQHIIPREAHWRRWLQTWCPGRRPAATLAAVGLWAPPVDSPAGPGSRRMAARSCSLCAPAQCLGFWGHQARVLQGAKGSALVGNVSERAVWSCSATGNDARTARGDSY